MKLTVRVAAGLDADKILIRMAGFSAIGHVVALVVFSVLPRFMQTPAPARPTIAEIIPASALFPPTAPGRSTNGPTPSQRADAAKQAARDMSRPKPDRAEPPRPAKPRPDKSVPPLEPRKPTEESPSRRPEPEPARAEANGGDAEAESQRHAAASSGITFSGPATVGGIPSIGSSGFPYDYYRASLVSILQSNWRRPVAPEGLAEPISCRLQFTILKSGIVQEPRIASPSGNQALDQSALRALYDSNPLPPLPFQYGQSSVSAEVVFELTSE